MTMFFFFQAEDGIRDSSVTGVQTCALPISQAAIRCRQDGRSDPPGRVELARRAARRHRIAACVASYEPKPPKSRRSPCFRAPVFPKSVRPGGNILLLSPDPHDLEPPLQRRSGSLPNPAFLRPIFASF